MKSLTLAGIILLGGLANPVFAGCGNGPSYLTQAQINTILASHYACGRSTANAPGWNELHSGSNVIEQHEAGTTDNENVGTWSTSTSGSRGRVTYTYGGGVVPVYEVATSANGNCGANCTTVPAIYEFCGVGGGAPTKLSILVSATLPTLSACPTN
jgi:hypothetical protein